MSNFTWKFIWKLHIHLKSLLFTYSLCVQFANNIFRSYFQWTINKHYCVRSHTHTHTYQAFKNI